jgi:hypothetical protein
MKLCTTFVAGVVVLTSGLSTARAVVVFQDNFDSYANQAAFESSWSLFTANPSSPSTSQGVLSQDQAVSPANSILVPANATTTNNLNRSEHDFTATPVLSVGDSIAFSFDFYDSNAAASPYRQFSEMRNKPGTSSNQLIAMGLNNNLSSSAEGGNYYMARLLFPSTTPTNPNGGANNAFFKLNFAGAPLRSTGWHNLKTVISENSSLNLDFKFYVDSILANQALNVGGTHRNYDEVNVGSGLSNGGNAAYYDNFDVEYIPAGAGCAPGDLNCDAHVDAGDYVYWRKNGGAPTTDYDAWRANFGSPAGSGSSLVAGAVPEPATTLLMAVGAVGLAVIRRRQS